MCNADALSRLPLPDAPSNSEIPTLGDVNYVINHLSTTLVTAEQIRSLTEKDPILSRIYHFVLHGWPASNIDPSLQPYYNRKDELSAVAGCVLWGARVVIPLPVRDQVLQQLHDSHPGITRMKSLARSYLWWPGLDTAITSLVQNCASYLQFKEYLSFECSSRALYYSCNSPSTLQYLNTTNDDRFVNALR